MGSFSLWHILILAVVLLLVFGGNRFSAMMTDVAKGLKSFKAGMSEDEEAKQREQQRDQQRPADPPRQIPPAQVSSQEPIDITPQAPRSADPAPPPPPRDDTAL